MQEGTTCNRARQQQARPWMKGAAAGSRISSCSNSLLIASPSFLRSSASLCACKQHRIAASFFDSILPLVLLARHRTEHNSTRKCSRTTPRALAPHVQGPSGVAHACETGEETKDGAEQVQERRGCGRERTAEETRRLAGLTSVKSRRGWLYQCPTSLSFTLPHHQHSFSMHTRSIQNGAALPPPSRLRENDCHAATVLTTARCWQGAAIPTTRAHRPTFPG